MESLIAIALIYSYIANGEREVANYHIGTFIDEIKENLRKLRSDYDINGNDLCNFIKIPPFSIDVIYPSGERKSLASIENKEELFENFSTVKYSLSSLDNQIFSWFMYFNTDLISASLGENALSHLDVKRSDLPIKSKEVSRVGNTTIYSLWEKEAREKARKYLEEDGFKNICMSAGRLCQPDDKAFQFSFSSDKMIDELDCYDNKFLEPVANLITIMQLEEYKREVLKRRDEDGKLPLDDVLLGKTALLDKDNNTVSREYQAVLKLTGDEEAFYNRMVAAMETGTSDVTVFINLLGDEVMNFFWQGKFSNKKYERVVEEIMLLKNSMKKDAATLEEIEEHVDKLNKGTVKKELSPDRR